MLSYVANGGRVVLATSPQNAQMPNLMRVAAAFGVGAMSGQLLEGNANYFRNSAENLVPLIDSNHEITQGLTDASYAPIMPNAHGILPLESFSEGMTASLLLATSGSAYVREQDGSERDVGQTAVGVALENTVSGARLVWYSSAEAFDSQATSTYGANANYYLAMAASWAQPDYESPLSSIEPTSLDEPTLKLPTTMALPFGAITVLVLPLALIVTGVSIRVRRARR